MDRVAPKRVSYVSTRKAAAMVGLLSMFVTQSYLLTNVIRAADTSNLNEFSKDHVTILEVPTVQPNGFEQVFLRTITRIKNAGPNVMVVGQPIFRGRSNFR